MKKIALIFATSFSLLFTACEKEKFDYDADGIENQKDNDDDNDGVLDAEDLDPLNELICGVDSDFDGCDDCSQSGFVDPENDGCEDCNTECENGADLNETCECECQCSEYYGELCDKQKEVTASPRFGRYEGTGFSFKLPACAEIVSFQTRSKRRIDKIIIGYKLDGEYSQVQFGGGGGELNARVQITSPIIAISGRSDNRIDALRLHFADGSSTPMWGDYGGEPFEIDVKNGFKGFYGNSGDEVFGLGVYHIK